MAKRDFSIVCGLALGSALASAAFGQQPPVQQPVREQLPPRPLDQAVEDLNPLSASFRETQVDLRQPLGFQNVYRVPGNDDLLMRSSGALNAVFPQSMYSTRGQGIVPLIPAGTVFFIGLPPGLAQPSQEMSFGGVPPVDARTESYVDLYAPPHLSARPAPGPIDESPVPVPPLQPRARTPQFTANVGQTIANDQSFRTKRIGELLHRAASEQSTADVDQGSR